MVQTERRLLWHPRLDNKFLVGGGNQLALYEWISGSSEIKHITSKHVIDKHDLQMMKCFAWSPDAAFDDLVAVGYNTGRVDLARLEATSSTSNHLVSSGPSHTLPVRNTRSCNALAFCSADPNYLAVGLDKVRGDSSLIIWDISTVTPSLSVETSQVPVAQPVSRPQPQIPRGDVGARTDTRILQQYAPAEIVSSVAWLPKSTTLLLAGISHRWLRLFDLRSNSPLVTNVASKVHGIATDPFDPHRIGCFGDGIATIWDARRISQPLLTFTEKDAAADGSRTLPNAVFTTMEFSSVRRGMLATLEKDATHVRFWDLQQADIVGRTPDGRMSRDSSQSSRAPRLSWANPSNMLSWSSPGPSHVSPPATPGEHSKPPYHLILSDTRKTKNFEKSLVSFSLVPSADPHPLTSNVMVVNKDGDLELYAVHDTPTHTPWSPRGELAMGIGRSYITIPGFHERESPPEPWDILMQPSLPNSTPHSLEKNVGRDHSSGRERRTVSPAPMFGRGDEDGFPALSTSSKTPAANLAATRPGRSRTYSPAALRNLHFEHTSLTKRVVTPASSSDNHSHSHALRLNGSIHSKGKHNHGHSRHAKDASPAWGHSTEATMQHSVEGDISMIMRKRVIQGYGLINPLHNSAVAKEGATDDGILSELWLWVHHAQQLLCVPTPHLEGFDFSYQGIMGIWEGFRPSRPHMTSQPTPRPSQRGLLLDAPPPPHSAVSNLGLQSQRARSDSRHTGRMRSSPPADPIPVKDDYLDAIVTLNARRDHGKASWRPPAATAKLPQRQLALHLCGWSLAEDDLANAIKRWEKEHRHSQAACWLVFTQQHKSAIELLMGSKDESHHMMSGMLAALSPYGTATKNHDLRDHCERLIVRLQDPYLRAMLTHLVNDDWSEVLQEEAIPLRERLAIAFQFLDDKEVSAYLRRVVDRCCHDGDIEGIIVTGLTSQGMDVLQTYVDTTGDIQTAAILSSLNPARARDGRAQRWLDSYRDLLDRWKLFHYRCQLDIDRGRILQEAIQQGEVAPFEWIQKQIILRCNYCSKSFNPPLQNNVKATTCAHCGKPLPRCSICLMSFSIMQDSARNAELSYSRSRDTIDEALVFCQTCRHGGHASHILEWFYGEDGSRSHGICPVANCQCRCADGF